jgi:hypothetical protein
MGSNAGDVELPWHIFIGDQNRPVDESTLGVLEHPTNDNIPVDSVRSAHVSGGDAILTLRGHVNRTTSVKKVYVNR